MNVYFLLPDYFNGQQNCVTDTQKVQEGDAIQDKQRF